MCTSIASAVPSKVNQDNDARASDFLPNRLRGSVQELRSQLQALIAVLLVHQGPLADRLFAKRRAHTRRLRALAPAESACPQTVAVTTPVLPRKALRVMWSACFMADSKNPSHELRLSGFGFPSCAYS